VIAALLISLSAGFSSSDPLALAFASRIYNPPSVQALSHSQVYTCALDGSRRRRWTSVKGDVWQVWWRSRNALRYVVSKGEEFDEDAPAQLREIDVLTGKDHLVRKGTQGKLHPETTRFRLQGDQTMGDVEEELGKANHSLKAGLDEDVVVVDGHRVDLGVPLTGEAFDRKSGQLWFFTYNHDSTTGADNRAYRLDWKTFQIEAVVSHADKGDFDTRRSTYAYVSQRDTVSYVKGHRVWMTQAIVGDWKKGTRYLIAGPKNLPDADLRQLQTPRVRTGEMSYQFSIAIRP